jgi:hypothetical protein
LRQRQTNRALDHQSELFSSSSACVMTAAARHSVAALGAELQLFAGQLGPEIAALRRNAEARLVTGASTYLGCLEDLAARAAAAEGDLATLAALADDAASLDELAGLAAEAYRRQHAASAALEARLASFGYRAGGGAPPPADPFEAPLEDSPPACAAAAPSPAPAAGAPPSAAAGTVPAPRARSPSLASPDALSPSVLALLGKYAAAASAPRSARPGLRCLEPAAPPSPAPALSPAFAAAAAWQSAQLGAAEEPHACEETTMELRAQVIHHRRLGA